MNRTASNALEFDAPVVYDKHSVYYTGRISVVCFSIEGLRRSYDDFYSAVECYAAAWSLQPHARLP